MAYQVWRVLLEKKLKIDANTSYNCLGTLLSTTYEYLSLND